MPTRRINGLAYHVEMHGSGPPLCLLHGFTGSVRSWAALLPALTEQFQVMLVDLPGHGRTAVPPRPERYRMEQVAADLNVLLGELTSAPLHLLGYSMGGRLALYFALHHPRQVDTLILESSSPGLNTAAERDARRRRDNALADWILENGIDPFVDRWEALPLWASQTTQPAEKRAALRRQRRQNSAAGLANSLRGMGTGVQPSLWAQLAECRLPVQLIVGELDEKFVRINREMAGLLPRARLEIISRAGHTVHWERPWRFVEVVRQWAAAG